MAYSLLRSTFTRSFVIAALALAGCSDDDSSAGEGANGTEGSVTTTDAASSGTAGVADDLPFPPAGPDAAPDPALMGPYPVGVMTVELRDDSRPTDEGEPRVLVTEIWYPAVEDARDQPGHVYTQLDIFTEEAQALLSDEVDLQLPTEAVRDANPRDSDEVFPVVLFSHGSSGVRMQSTFLTVFLASHGYVVASPDHIGNTLSDAVVNGGASTEAQFESIGLRPDDMMFVLDHLQGLAVDDPLGAITDGSRVGAAGHSLGAMTTLRMLAQDRPIDVAVAQTPPGYDTVWFGALALEPEDLTIPVMIQAGEVDATTPLADAESIFTKMNAPRSMLTVNDAGHFTFSDMCVLDPEAIETATQIGLSAALGDGCDVDNITPALALPLQRHFAIGLFNGHLRDSPGSLELLTVDAADALAPGMFELTYEQ